MTARNEFSTTAARVTVGDNLVLGGIVVEKDQIRHNNRVLYRIRTVQLRGFGEFADDLISSIDYYSPSHRLDLR